MGERFWLQMYREAKEDTRWWFNFAMGQSAIIAVLVAVFIYSLR